MIIIINVGTSLRAHLFVLELEVFGDNTELTVIGDQALLNLEKAGIGKRHGQGVEVDIRQTCRGL